MADLPEAKRRINHWINAAIPLSSASYRGYMQIAERIEKQMNQELNGTGYRVDPVLWHDTNDLTLVKI